VAQSLRVELSDVTATTTGVPDSTEAYEAYLQGRFFHNRRGPGDSERAALNFQRALEIDPAYGRAWAGLAGTWLIRIVEEGADTEANRESWREAAEQALRHAPHLAEAQMRAAQYYSHNGDRARAREHFEKASALNPNHPLVLGGVAGDHFSHGRIDLAIEYARRGAARDPLSAIAHGNLASFLSAAGRFDEALVEFHRAMDLNPDSDKFRLGIGEIYILQGRFDEALQLVQQVPDGAERDRDLALIYRGLGRAAESDAALQRLRSRSGPGIEQAVADVYAGLGEPDESFKWLFQGRQRVPAGTRIDEWVDSVQGSPFLIPLRADPRWREVTVLVD
jgi:tetratricopeptide (TPR) repeat protein